MNLPKKTEYQKWLEAQIALQREVLDSLKNKEQRAMKEGQIALLELDLKKKRKK